MNIKDVLRYGWQGARERATADAKPNPYADRPGLESRSGPIGAISRIGGNIGRGVLGFFSGDDDRPPILSRANRNPSYGIPASLNPQDQTQGPPSDLAQPWQSLPDYTGEMTEAERQQQREQFDRYRNDPNSIYYQGSNFDRMRTPNQIVGPNAHTFNSPTRGLYDSMDVRTGSGQGFNDAVAYYRSIQKPNPNITR